MRPWIFAVLALVTSSLTQGDPGLSPTESIGCEPHGDHWHCDGPASTAITTTTHSHEQDEEATITPTVPNPTGSIGCEPHGDHWHCDGPVSTSPVPTATGEHDHEDDDDSSITPTVPSPTESVGCEPHGDHWHCDGPRVTSASVNLSGSPSVSPSAGVSGDIYQGAAGTIQVQLSGVVVLAVGAAALLAWYSYSYFMMDLHNATLPSQPLSYFELLQFAKQDPGRSLPEQLWWAHYAFWDNDILATGIITFLAHELIYFGRCLPWIIADALPSIFHRYKIQDQKPPPSALDQWTCTKYILLIHFIIELPLIVLFHPMMDLCGLQYTIPFPRLSLLAAQITLFFIVEDTYHYWLHRFMHWGPLYRSIHRVHHQYAAPFGLTAEYASPWETFFLGFGTIGPPLILGKVTGDVHLVTVLAWMALRQLQAIDAHSGYDFPWSLRRLIPFWGGADWHDDHHRYFRGNYSSSFKHWDILMGTVAGPRGKAMGHKKNK